MLTACSQFGHLADYERDVTDSALGQRIVGRWFKTKVEMWAYKVGAPHVFVRPYIMKLGQTFEDGSYDYVPYPHKYYVDEGTVFQITKLKVKSSHLRKATPQDRVWTYMATFYPKDKTSYDADVTYLFKWPFEDLEPNPQYIEPLDVID
jgi:hypothetical protein